MSRPTVLIVDDEEHVTRSQARSLRDQFRVLIANSSEAALEIAAREEIAVVLADQRMPGLTGIQLPEHTRQIRPDTIGILICGPSTWSAATAGMNLCSCCPIVPTRRRAGSFVVWKEKPLRSGRLARTDADMYRVAGRQAGGVSQ